MNVQRVLGTGIVSSAVALSTLALSGCDKNSSSKENNITEKELVSTDSIDLTKPNLPVIGKEYIQYRGLDGKTHKVVNSDNTAALYQAIAKMSTKEEPDILDPETFYVEVQKEIQKAPDNWNNSKDISESIDKHRLSSYFDKLYNRFAAFESEEGSNITVREYTMMMDAFSKTSKEVPYESPESEHIQ